MQAGAGAAGWSSAPRRPRVPSSGSSARVLPGRGLPRSRVGPLRMLSVGSSPGSMLLRCCLSVFPKQAICPQKGSNGKRYKYSKWWKQEVERKRCSYSQKTDCHFSSVNTYSARFQKQACLNLQNSLPARGTLRRAAPRAVPGSWGVSATAAGPLPRKSY